jgi:NTE family protein
MEPEKRALVLSGGSIKGAFQAGAIGHLLNRGFTPDLLCGISVGSLNAAFLADRAGRAKIAGHDPDWPKIGAELEAFWRHRVTKPADIAKIQSRWKIAWKALWKKFDGLAQTGPLKNLVSKDIFVENLRASPVQFRVGAVNLVNGDIVYASEASANIIDYIVASTAEPISMPLSDIDGAPFYDGGLRDIAPLSHALDLGASEIVCIACQPEKLMARDFNRGNLFHLIGRVLDIITNEILKNDLAKINQLGKLLKDLPNELRPNPLAPYVDPKIALIRPDERIEVHIDSFTQADIHKMLEQGRYTASRAY